MDGQTGPRVAAEAFITRLAGSGVGVAWGDKAQTRLYFQSTSGAICEMACGSKWSGPKTIVNAAFKPRVLAAIAANNGQLMRVPYLAGNDELSEARYSSNGGWNPG